MSLQPRPASGLWAVTSFFNPSGYPRKLVNYRAFRQHLTVPLVAVEQGFGGRFELGPGDADVLVHADGGDVLWQKERLLNLGLAALPDSCEAVAWLDCDVVFEDAGWPRDVLAALERFPLVQPFRTVYDLPRDLELEEARACPRGSGRESLASAMTTGRLPVEIFRVQGASLKLGYSPGHAWAARRNLLRGHGLYDAFVMGGGDKVMASAAFGHFDHSIEAFQLNDRQAKHYLEWAVPFHESVAGRVGFADQAIFHLWHGDLSKRRYANRYGDFGRFEFDPFKDIQLAGSGCWAWNSDKPEMHEQVRRFFMEREGDDPAP